MALDDIKALKIPAAEDCVLFLWATIPMLPEAHAVMDAWGFTYKSAIVWVKDKAGIGYWVRGQAEMLLIGTRGDVPAPGPGNQPDAVIEAPRGRHSEKPEVFAEEIERLYPNVPKLEMFARAVRFGWGAWGNEVCATDVTETSPPTAPEPQSEAGDAEALVMEQLQKTHKRYRLDRAMRYRARQAAKK
jgi:N6-adenosine-specific RNA methylase IME4